MPTTQPFSFPTGQPSSLPSYESSTLIILVDNATEFTVSSSRVDQYCVPNHWLRNMEYSGHCNIYAAFMFCLHRVPWRINPKIKDCRIHLPAKIRITFRNLGLIIDTSLSQWRNSPPLRITFSGETGSYIYTTRTKRNTVQSKFLRIGGMTRNDSTVIMPYVGAVDVFKVPLSLGFENITFVNIGQQFSDIGGCIEVANVASVSFRMVSMINYWALEGGAVYLYNIGQVMIENSYFKSNSAVNGGGIFLASVGDVTIKGTTFVDNFADNIGGALVIESARSVAIQFYNRFLGNTAPEYGGALSMNNIATSTIIRASSFISNLAKVGSAIVMSNCRGSEVSSNIFDGNDANVGTVYWLASSGMAAPIERGPSNQFTVSNRCKLYGCSFAT